MKTISVLCCSLAFVSLTGCWTVSETEFPVVTAAEGRGIRVKIAKFRAGFSRYCPVEGHEAMSDVSVNGGGTNEILKAKSDEVTVLKETVSGRLAARLVGELKYKGFVIDKKTPQYTIEFSFGDPTFPNGDVLRQVCYGFCTLFTSENMIMTRSAHVTLRDGKTNKVVYQKDYEQTYDVTVWGPIPVGSPACNKKVSYNGANSWVLTALTDRAIADVTAFMAARH